MGYRKVWLLSMKESKINYEEFVSRIRCQLYEIIPEDLNMEVNPVLKNNSVHLDSLVLFRDSCGCSPSFYLQDYYAQYLRGVEIDALAEDIYERWQSFMDSSGDVLPDLSFEHCRKYVVYRLVNAAKNKEILKDIPHIPFFDLAIVFYYLINSDINGIQSLRINNHIMKNWSTNTQELFELAQENTPRLFPESFRSMTDYARQFADSLCCSADLPLERSPYILTNSNGINGASVWLYPGILERVGEELGENFYILPSSTHELLILREQLGFTSPELLKMVFHVNRECVDAEEFLSDNIYYYHIGKKAIKMIPAVGSTQKGTLQND